MTSFSININGVTFHRLIQEGYSGGRWVRHVSYSIDDKYKSESEFYKDLKLVIKNSGFIKELTEASRSVSLGL